eukprot:11165548-Lingulodinium_polyedra.AAC.1
MLIWESSLVRATAKSVQDQIDGDVAKMLEEDKEYTLAEYEEKKRKMVANASAIAGVESLPERRKIKV